MSRGAGWRVAKSRLLAASMAATALAFGLMSTVFFGGNFTPKTPHEFICDGITLIAFELAAIIYVFGERKD